MKCALFDTRVFVQKRCSGSTIFLHLSATSQVVGHHRGRVKGKKEKWKKGARTGMQIFDCRIVIRHSTEWFTQRGETRQCVFIRTQILRTSTFCIPSTMLGWYFYSTLLAATEVGHHRERVKNADGYANFRTNVFR